MILLIASSIALRATEHTLLIDDVGPLYLIWLVVTNPSLKRRIAEVEEPSVDRLRRAGMVNLQAHNLPVGIAQAEYHNLWKDDDELEARYLSQEEWHLSG